MPSAHAVRNASGAERWMNCPGSIRMEDGRPNNSSDAARLGTAAHALGEACLLDGSDAMDWFGGYVRLDQTEQATVHRFIHDEDSTVEVPVHASKDGLPPEGHEDFPIDANMADAVQVYLDAVREEVERLGEHAELQVERRFNLSWLVGYDFDEEVEKTFEETYGAQYVSPSGIMRVEHGILVKKDGTVSWGPMFGTNDASVVLLFDHVSVFDYKHGQGHIVEVEDNVQELYYALGAAQELKWAFETLDLIIVQPRARHADGPVRRWSTTKAYLREYEARLREAALATEDPDAPLKAGGHCTFCKAAAVCPELKEDAYRVAGLDFDDDGEVTYLESGAETSDEDLGMRLAALPLLDAFVKSVQTEAMRRLKETPGGQTCFGKLVRKKSNRVFRTDLTEEDQSTGEEVPVNVFDKLVQAGIPREMLFEAPKPKSPAKVEGLRPPELMAKLKAEKVKAPAAFIKGLVAQFTIKPEGGVTIAPLSDPRDAVDPSTTAASDFDEFSEE